MDYTVLFIVWGICGVLSAVVAQSKGNNPGSAFVIGVIFGPLGLLFTLLQKRGFRVEAVAWGQPKRCPATDASGWQCVLAAGHEGSHSAR